MLICIRNKITYIPCLFVPRTHSTSSAHHHPTSSQIASFEFPIPRTIHSHVNAQYDNSCAYLRSPSTFWIRNDDFIWLATYIFIRWIIGTWNKSDYLTRGERSIFLRMKLLWLWLETRKGHKTRRFFNRGFLVKLQQDFVQEDARSIVANSSDRNFSVWWLQEKVVERWSCCCCLLGRVLEELSWSRSRKKRTEALGLKWNIKFTNWTYWNVVEKFFFCWLFLLAFLMSRFVCFACLV